jgi:molybdenum cofactor biosynthesis protein MoaC
MTVRVRLFAILRERAGRESLEVELREGATVADAIERLSECEQLAELFARMPLRLAVNRAYADPETPLRAGDELALVPPISGGAGPRVRVTAEPITAAGPAAAVADPGAGAIVTFQGVTREVERLDYEAYTEMAEERIAAILSECIERHGLLGAAAEHRVGPVPRGEPAVIVAASAAHREQAFAGAREAIDRIKAEAPIWKREVDGDGSGAWVEGQAPPFDAPISHERLSHLGEDGRARMVDVGAKPATERRALARARLRMSPQTARAVATGAGPKGEVLEVARFAGIQAAKQTAALIPLAHPLPLSFVDISASIDEASGRVELAAEARTTARTGVEMEAMTACAVAALTIYDMVKGVERGVEIEQVVLLEKSGGRSDWILGEGDRAVDR